VPFSSPSDPELMIIAMLSIETIGCHPLRWGGIARYRELGISSSINESTKARLAGLPAACLEKAKLR